MTIAESHFLYVEDDMLSCQVMDMMLRNGLGVQQLTIFEDSHDFMTRVRSLPSPPDLVLLDVHVAPNNGFEMLQMIREDEDYRNLKVIALTASVMNEEVEQLRRSGFDGAIAKPLSISTFPQLIAGILNGDAVWHIA